MSAAAATISDPQAAKVALVLDALARDADLSTAEHALLDELARVPEVQAAVAQRDHRMHWRRVEAARAIEAQREAGRAERVEERRAAWRAAPELVRVLHVAAERVRGDSQNGKLLLMLAGLLEAGPNATLLTRGGVDEFGEKRERVERAPPLTFEPTGTHQFDDPVNEETR